MATAHLAIDCGASSGRAMLGILDGKPATLSLHEVHRFKHQSLCLPSGPAWEITTLWREILVGLQRGVEAARDAGAELTSIGVDTWGVDWALVNAQGELLGLPHCYRDPANLAAKQRVLDRFPGGLEAIYAQTGIQPLPFNTLYQLDRRGHDQAEAFAALAAQSQLLLLPDLFHYWLSGVKRCERTNASTTSMLNATTGEWDRELIEAAGAPTSLLPRLVDPGTVLGPLRPELALELGIEGEPIQVVTPATHDTASAVAAVPSVDDAAGSWAYLSSGTWSLLGVELAEPTTTTAALASSFTNERGVENRIRFLRNIGGLWLVQELKRDYEKQGETFTFAQLAEQAEDAEPLRTLIDPNVQELADPGESISKLQRIARHTNQPIPETPGQLTRCCLESLALCYAETIDRIEKLTPSRIEKLYLVGGGVNNRLLNRLTAAACGRTVLVGPSEASAIGNALVQAMGLGQIKNLAELRAIVDRSFETERVEAEADERWESARARYEQLVERSERDSNPR